MQMDYKSQVFKQLGHPEAFVHALCEPVQYSSLTTKHCIFRTTLQQS